MVKKVWQKDLCNGALAVNMKYLHRCYAKSVVPGKYASDILFYIVLGNISGRIYNENEGLFISSTFLVHRVHSDC